MHYCNNCFVHEYALYYIICQRLVIINKEILNIMFIAIQNNKSTEFCYEY